MRTPDRRISLSLGENTVEVHTFEASAPRWLVVHVHENEMTALRAALALVGRRQISLRTLVHAHERRIAFQVDGQRWTLDPNRCFARAGIVRDLIRNNGRTPPGAVLDEVERFGESVIEALEIHRARAVIAAHNNLGSNALTIQEFAPGGDRAEAAARCHHNPALAPEDFFLVTREAEYAALVAMDWNAILQRPDAADDGSLSVYCARHGIPYVNVESQHARRGDEAPNIVMLQDALHVLEETLGSGHAGSE